MRIHERRFLHIRTKKKPVARQTGWQYGTSIASGHLYRVFVCLFLLFFSSLFALFLSSRESVRSVIVIIIIIIRVASFCRPRDLSFYFYFFLARSLSLSLQCISDFLDTERDIDKLLYTSASCLLFSFFLNCFSDYSKYILLLFFRYFLLFCVCFTNHRRLSSSHIALSFSLLFFCSVILQSIVVDSVAFFLLVLFPLV